MRAPALQQIGYLGIGPEVDHILHGHYKRRPGTDDGPATLPKHIAKVDPTQPDLPLGVSRPMTIPGDRLKKIKERTSAGGSTLHFGHCKACSKMTTFRLWKPPLSLFP
jgi:hypothetical protein